MERSKNKAASKGAANTYLWVWSMAFNSYQSPLEHHKVLVSAAK